MQNEIKQLTHLKDASTLRRMANLPGPRHWLLVGSLMMVKASRIHFEPERWMGSTTNAFANNTEVVQPADALQIDKRISLPFGAGPRTCPGRYLALLEVKIVVAMVQCHFKIDSLRTPDGKVPQEMMAFVMSPVGLSMRLRLRSRKAPA